MGVKFGAPEAELRAKGAKFGAPGVNIMAFF